MLRSSRRKRPNTLRGFSGLALLSFFVKEIRASRRKSGFDGSTVWIYRNGIEVTSGTLTSNNANPTYVPRIGYSTNGNDFKYDGYFGYVEMSSQHKPSVVAISRYNSRKANSDFVTFGTASTPLLANVETNSIFIKTDTNKRYWYDGTTWVEQV